MRFAVVGGDKSAALLCCLLCRDGHRVQSFGLEKAEMPGEIHRAGSLFSCVYGTDCVVLPEIPEQKELICGSCALETISLEELRDCLWPGQLLIGEQLSEGLCRKLKAQGLRVEDLSRRRSYALRRAILCCQGELDKGRLLLPPPGLPELCPPYALAKLKRQAIYELI